MTRVYSQHCVITPPSPHTHTHTVDAAVSSVNQTLEGGDADQTLAALQNEDLDVPDLYPENKEYYHGGLLAMKGGKGGGSLKEEEIKAGVKEMNEKAEYDRSGKLCCGFSMCMER